MSINTELKNELKNAIRTIETLHGFDDVTTGAGEAWGVVLSYIDMLDKRVDMLERELAEARQQAMDYAGQIGKMAAEWKLRETLQEARNILEYADGLIAKHETLGTTETMWQDQYKHWKAATNE